MPSTIRWLIVALVTSLAAIDAAAQSPSRLDLKLSPAIGDQAPAATAAGLPTTPSARSQRIDAGDAVTVTVYREPDLSISGQRVRSDGTISLPLLGDLKVDGLDTRQLQAIVTERLADGYLKQPDVTVTVEQHRLFYIKGEVSNPGGYSFVDGLTIEKAIALAGGFTERASRRGFTVVRESDPGRPIKGLSPAAEVMPGDVITVEESFF